MDDFDFARLTYLVVLGSAVVFWFFAVNRGSMNKVLQQAMIWGFLFIGVIAAYGLWDDVRRSSVPQQMVSIEGGQVELPLSSDGHYYLTADVNGAFIDFVVDTGATDIVLSEADARRAGFTPSELDYIGRAQTANGEVRIAPVRIDRFAVGGIEDVGVRAVVNEGDLDGSLLGMSYLQRFNSVEISGGRLVLTR
ncbi:MAG: TIGR02281 family clan AA aspartic protease [Pseudomonadota bacterium]